MKSILVWGLRQRRTALIWWSVGIVAFIALELAFYPTLHSQAEEISRSLGQLPSTVKSLVGTIDYASPVGYLNGRVFYLVLPMLLSIFAIGQGSSLIAREEQQGTIELLLSRPISRTRLLVSKAVLGIVSLLIITLVSTGVIVIMNWIVKLHVSILYTFLASLLCALFALCLGALAYMLTAMGKFARGASIGIAALVGLGGYIIASLANDIHWLHGVSKLLPFYYYRPSEVLYGTYSWVVCSYFILTTLGMGVVAWIAFRRRDIST